MPPFRFIQARLPDPARSRAQITARLLAHRRKLLAARQQQTAALIEAAAKNDLDWLNQKDPLRPDPEESRKIERRATKISDRFSQGSGLSHLKPDDLKKLEALRGGVRLVQIETEHQADELAAALHAEFPWMGPATEAVWHGMRLSARDGDIGLRLPLMLLDSLPGIGKSAWARTLANLIKVPTIAYEATVENASFGLVGS
ncbi:hypothetical protein [Paracoccus tegillarcae]|uniref:hypothetical protein n=1 Tax=Paracoccus tegillarcae TaxID=1529068 RepID=UPI001E2EB0CB|nr:hypothetical protein [Paracoccus tegillarcae]